MFECLTEEHLWMTKCVAKRLLTVVSNFADTVKSPQLLYINGQMIPNPSLAFFIYDRSKEIRANFLPRLSLHGQKKRRTKFLAWWYYPPFAALSPCSHTRFGTFFIILLFCHPTLLVIKMSLCSPRFIFPPFISPVQLLANQKLCSR